MKYLLIISFLFISVVSYSQTYQPKEGATLASSLDCWNKAMAAVEAGDMDGFQSLTQNGCILLYQKSSHGFELVLVKVRGITQPNLYYIKGYPDTTIYALGSQLTEK